MWLHVGSTDSIHNVIFSMLWHDDNKSIVGDKRLRDGLDQQILRLTEAGKKVFLHDDVSTFGFGPAG